MSAEWRGVPPPVKGVKNVYDVLSPGLGESHDLTFLDARILGTECHWVPDQKTGAARSRLCTVHEGKCPYCGKERLVWVGWIAVIVHARRGREVLRLGRESALRLSALASPGTGLAGKRMKVTRSKSHRTGPLSFELSPLAAPDPLPEPHDIEPTICLVLGCRSLPDYRFTKDDLGRVPT